MDNTIILKYITGKASSIEKKKFLDWIDAPEDNLNYYRKIRELWDSS
jgi:hypothetical protein